MPPTRREAGDRLDGLSGERRLIEDSPKEVDREKQQDDEGRQ
jgi:hypothetical protein